jgi:hypothetical protein
MLPTGHEGIERAKMSGATMLYVEEMKKPETTVRTSRQRQLEEDEQCIDVIHNWVIEVPNNRLWVWAETN